MIRYIPKAEYHPSESLHNLNSLPHGYREDVPSLASRTEAGQSLSA